MDWTPIIIASIAATPGLIVALMGWRATRVVHTIVNSQRTAMTNLISIQDEKIVALEKIISTFKEKI